MIPSEECEEEQLKNGKTIDDKVWGTELLRGLNKNFLKPSS